MAENGLTFTPETFTLVAGETVRWVWRGGGHNVIASDTPDETDWQGTPGGPGTTYGAGHTYEHTFTVPGTYAYFCKPHREFGMMGNFEVFE